MFGKKENNEEEIKRKQVNRFHLLLYSLMNELFEYTQVRTFQDAIYLVSFGLIHGKADSVLLNAIDKKIDKKLYLYNAQIIKSVWGKKRR